MLSLSDTLERIKEKNLPFWKLKIKGSSTVYDSHDTEDIEASMETLEKAVMSVNNPSAVFEFSCRGSKTANGDSIKGWPFTVSGEYPRLGSTSSQNGFGGLGAMDMLSISQNINQQYENKLVALEAKKEKLDQERIDNQTEKFKLEMERTMKIMELDRRDKDLLEKEHELKQGKKELEDLLDKRVKQGEVVLGKILGKKFDEWLGVESGLKGADGKAITTQEPETPEEKAIESIAVNINENVKNIDNIKNIGVAVQALIADPDLYKFFIKHAADKKSETETTTE